MTIDLPDNLVSLYEASSFCPRQEPPTNAPVERLGWNAVRIECEAASDDHYPSCDMFFDYHQKSGGVIGVSPAQRPFADWGNNADGKFVKAMIDWFQSMSPATK